MSEKDGKHWESCVVKQLENGHIIDLKKPITGADLSEFCATKGYNASEVMIKHLGYLVDTNLSENLGFVLYNGHKKYEVVGKVEYLETGATCGDPRTNGPVEGPRLKMVSYDKNDTTLKMLSDLMTSFETFLKEEKGKSSASRIMTGAVRRLRNLLN